MLREIGRLVALLHDGGMVHGDLTTSNMLLRGNISLVRHVLAPHFLTLDMKGGCATAELNMMLCTGAHRLWPQFQHNIA